MSVDRDAVRDAARYLRNVRPVDPEEIYEYVEGRPHPAVVRRTLREEAFSLGLVERDDGSFVPVADDPLPPPGWAPGRLPERYERVVEELLVERFGGDWHRGESGRRLREAVRRLKADYYHGNPVEYDETAALGYAIYHLPDYYAATGYVLDELAETGRLPRKLRVLDVGAGVGGPALALHDYLLDAAGDDPPLVEYRALEPSPAADVLERLLAETGPNFRTRIHRERAEAFDPESVGPVDLLSFCNVLSELSDPVAVAERYLAAVAADGTLLAVAPADLETSTGLREVERALADREDGPSVYSPTLRLWPGEGPADRGWSFDAKPDVEAPAVQRRLDRGRDPAELAESAEPSETSHPSKPPDAPERDEPSDAVDPDPPGTFLKTTVQFSHSLLRPDGARRVDVRASPERHAKMAEMDRHVSKRVDLLAVKLSVDLSRRGEGSADDRRRSRQRRDPNPLFKVGDGSERVEQYAVCTRESALNRDLLEAPYGAVLAFENVLVLWNDDEGAYNLVVDDSAVVDVVAV